MSEASGFTPCTCDDDPTTCLVHVQLSLFDCPICGVPFVRRESGGRSLVCGRGHRVPNPNGPPTVGSER